MSEFSVKFLQRKSKGALKRYCTRIKLFYSMDARLVQNLDIGYAEH